MIPVKNGKPTTVGASTYFLSHPHEKPPPQILTESHLILTVSLELEKAIRDYIRLHNKEPSAFVWTASASRILRKVRRCKEALETGD